MLQLWYHTATVWFYSWLQTLLFPLSYQMFFFWSMNVLLYWSLNQNNRSTCFIVKVWGRVTDLWTISKSLILENVWIFWKVKILSEDWCLISLLMQEFNQIWIYCYKTLQTSHKYSDPPPAHHPRAQWSTMGGMQRHLQSLFLPSITSLHSTTNMDY